MIALFEAYKAGLLKKKYQLNNLIAGIIVGIVAMPLSMAFAIASGVTPEQGIYTAIIAGVIVSIFGGSRVQIAGPTGAFIVMLSGITIKYGIDGLQIATLLAGIMLIIMGVLRLGNIIKLIPETVILGFTAGIGVIIFVSQWKDFFGLPMVTGEHFHQKLWSLFNLLPQFNLATTILSALALFLLIYNKNIPFIKKIPAPLVAMLVITAIQIIMQFDDIATIGSTFNTLKAGLPKFNYPLFNVFNMNRILELLSPAFSIAMLGAIESLLSAIVADNMLGTRHNSNQELIGQGLANIITPLFGGFAATGAIARTATNIRNGGNSPLAGIIHAVTLICILLIFAPYARHIPLAVLAAILFIVAWNMSDIPHLIKTLKNSSIIDIGILFITFVLTVFVDLIIGVSIGMLLSMLQSAQAKIALKINT